MPRQNHNLCLIEKFLFMGSDKNVRDWLFVEDGCEAINLVLHKGKTRENYEGKI